MIKRFLFVCHGNINRSACAEIIMKQLKPRWQVKSAAVGRTIGDVITTKKMREVLKNKGYNEFIRSTAITKELVDWADIIYYMDESNRTNLVKHFGMGVLLKCRHLGIFVGLLKIPDPNYSKGTVVYQAVADKIETAIKKIIRLNKKGWNGCGRGLF